MYTGMSTACFYGRMLNEDALRQIGALGVRNAEVFFSAQMEYRPDFVRELKDIIDSEGIRMVSVHALPTQFEPQLFARHPRQLEEAVGVFRNVLAAARMLGAQIYVFHGPVHLKVARSLELDMDFVGETVSRLADIAGEYGVALCYENVHWCWFKTPDFARDLLAHCDSDNLWFTLDMKQAAQSGYAFADYIDATQGRLRHVHVCDYTVDAEKGILPCLPFTGQTDWDALKIKLKDAGYDGCMMMEVYANNYNTFDQLKENYDRINAFFSD